MITRRFLIAPALARLIRYYRGSAPVTEGFFEQRSGRSVLLRIKGRATQLVLTTPRHDQDPDESVAEIPAEHALALLVSCAGKVSFEESGLPLTDGQEVLVRRFNGLSVFATATVGFADRDTADRFVMPTWFGSEVTDDDAYTNRGLALSGIPRLGEVSITDPALNSVMDLLEKQPKPARESAEAAPAGTEAELAPETLSALTEGMERAIAGTILDESAEAAAPAPEKRRPFGGSISPFRRESFGRLREGLASGTAAPAEDEAREAVGS